MLFRPSKSSFSLPLLLVAGIKLSSAAHAQTLPQVQPAAAAQAQDVSSIPEVVITAQRKSERLQDVPISVEAFTSKQLQAAGVVSAQDLPMVTPGLVFGQQAGYAQPYLRGVGTVAAGPGIENPIALYVDGVYYSSAGGGVLSLASIDQIEVDKGPQGTLFGRNATGGLIQITTKDPSATFGGQTSLTYGDYVTAGADLYLTGAVTQNIATNLAARFFNQQDGYGENLYNGRPVSKTQDLVLRNKWLFIASDNTRIKLTLDYEKSRYIPNYGPAPGTTALGAASYPVPPQDIAGVFQPFGDIHEGGASLDIRHDFGFAQLVSITAYRQNLINADAAASLSVDPTFGLSSVSYDRHEQITQELDLSAPKSDRIHWTVGAYFYDSHAQFSPPLFTTGGLITLDGLTYIDNYSNQRDYSGALYGQATTEVLAATNLTVGLRYTAEHRSFNGDEVFGFDGGSQVLSDAEHKMFDKLTWRFALDHHFGQDVMAYVSYNRGFKSGGFNDAIIPTVAYAPETLDAYELGSKVSLFDHHLTLNASAFLYKYQNVQEIVYQVEDFLIYNGARARDYGLDLDAQWKPISDLTLTAGLEAIHDRFTDFPDAAISTPMEGGGTAYTTGAATGNRVPLTADFTSTLSADYVVRLDALGSLEPTVTYLYNSGFYGEPDNRLHQPSYNVVNAQVAWTPPDHDWQVRLWGKNLNDAQFVTSLGSQPNGDFAVFAPPRTYGVTVSRSF